MIGYSILFVSGLLIAISFLGLADSVNNFGYFICGLITITSLGIHINYYLEDNGKEILVSKSKINISLNGEKKIYEMDQLIKITVVGSKNIEDFGIKQFPAEDYFYAELDFSDGTRLYITSLMIGTYNNLRKAFPEKYLFRRYGLYNTLEKKRPKLDVNIL